VALKSFDCEGGTSGATVTTADTGSGDQITDRLFSGSPTLQYSNAQAMHGSQSVLINAVATTQQASLGWSGYTATDISVRFYLRLNSAPAVGTHLCQIRHSGSAVGLALNIAISGGNPRLTVLDRNGSTVFDPTTSNNLSLNTWYRIEVRTVRNTATSGPFNGVVQHDVYAGDSATPLYTGTSLTNVDNNGSSATNTFGIVRMGKPATAGGTLDCYIDSLAVNDGLGSYIGPAGTSATATPSVAAGTGAVGSPAVSTGSAIAPTVVAASASVGSVTAGAADTSVTNSAESGATAGDGTVVTTGNSGGASGTAFWLAPGTPCTFDDATASHGTWSYRVVAAATQIGQLALLPGATDNRVAARCYFYLHSRPAAATDLIQLRPLSGGNAAKIVLTSTGRLQAQTTTGSLVGSQSAAIPLNTWLRIEIRAEVGTTSSNGTISAAYYVGDSFSATWTASSTATNAGTTAIGEVRFGKPASAGDLSANYDSLAVDHNRTSFIGPIVASPTPAAVTASATIPAPTVGGSSVNGRLVQVQGWNPTSSGTAAVASLAGTFPSTPTSGNTLFAAVVSENAVSTPAGWEVATSAVGTSATYLFYKTAGGAESTSVTFTPTASSAMAVAVAEYEGPTTVDSTASATAAGASLSTGTATLAHPADFVVAVFGAAGTAPAGIGNPTGGFTEAADISTSRSSGVDVNLSVGTLRTSSSGAYAATATAAGTVTGGGGLVVGFRLELTNTQPRPSTVAGVATVPQASAVAQADRTVTVATVAMAASLGAAVVDTPGRTQVNVTTVAATATVTTIASAITSSTVTATVVAATTTVPAPGTIGSGVALVNVLAAAVAGAAAIGTPTVVRGTAMTAPATTVSASVAVPVPGVTLGIAITATPATVETVASVAPPTITAPDVAFEVTTVGATTTVPGVVIVITESRYVFRSPVVSEYVLDQRGRPRWWRVNQGITLLKIDGSYREVRYPTDDEIAAAEVVYRGGFEIEISHAEAEDLELAGYGSYVSTIS
jgi:hypothetical protein